MSAPSATGASSSTTTVTTAQAPVASGPTPASTTSRTSTTNSTANSAQQPPQTTWQKFKNLLPSSGATQICIGLVALVLTILGIRWGLRSYYMARWTALKDFRDDCRSAQASGGTFSKACDAALERELEPPPYFPASYFSRLRKRYFNTTRASESRIKLVHGFRVLVWKALSAYYQSFLLFSTNSNIRSAGSFCLEPLVFNTTSFLVRSVVVELRPRQKNTPSLQDGFYNISSLLAHVLLWPFWVVENNRVRRINTILSGTAISALTLVLKFRSESRLRYRKRICLMFITTTILRVLLDWGFHLLIAAFQQPANILVLLLLTTVSLTMRIFWADGNITMDSQFDIYRWVLAAFLLSSSLWSIGVYL